MEISDQQIQALLYYRHKRESCIRVNQIIGHAPTWRGFSAGRKTDIELDRNHLTGEEGKQMDTIIAGCDFNYFWKTECLKVRWIHRANFFVPDLIQRKIGKIWQYIRNADSGYPVVKMQAVRNMV
ncbi:hypothetical protein HQ531_06670 [bacterium]|nr:hypothetical protein [bacterium]